MEDLTKLFEGELERASVVLQISALSDSLQDIAEKLTKMTADVMPITDAIKSLYSEEAGTKFDDNVRQAISSAFDAVRETKDNVVREKNRLEGGISDEDVTTPSNDMMDDEPSRDFSGDESELDSLLSDENTEETSDETSGSDVGMETSDKEDEVVDDLFGGEEAASGPKNEPLGRAKKESHSPSGKAIMESPVLDLTDLEDLPSMNDEVAEDVTIPLNGEVADLNPEDVEFSETEAVNPIYNGPVSFVSVRFPDSDITTCEQLEHEVELLAVAHGGDREMTVKGTDGFGFSVIFPAGSDEIQSFITDATAMGAVVEYDPNFIQQPVDDVVEMAERYLSTLSENDTDLRDRMSQKIENAIVKDAAKARAWLESKLNPVMESPEEGADSTYSIYGKVFNTKTFTNQDAANAFMEENEDWGVIGEKDGIIHLAHMDDDGTIEEDTYRTMGREFETKTFDNERDAQDFIAQNPGWGIIGVEDDVVHVAKMSDTGEVYMEDISSNRVKQKAINDFMSGMTDNTMTGDEMVDELLLYMEDMGFPITKEDAERAVYTEFPDAFPHGFTPRDISESALMEFQSWSIPRSLADAVWAETDVNGKRKLLLSYVEKQSVPRGQKEFATRAIQQGSAVDLDSWATDNVED